VANTSKSDSSATSPVAVATARVEKFTAQVAATKGRIADFQALTAQNDSAAAMLADKIGDALAANQPPERISEAREATRVREADLKLALTKLNARLATEETELGEAVAEKRIADLNREWQTLAENAPRLRKKFSEASEFVLTLREESDRHDARVLVVARTLGGKTNDALAAARIDPGTLEQRVRYSHEPDRAAILWGTPAVPAPVKKQG